MLPNYCRSFREEAFNVWRDMSETEGLQLPRSEETTTEQLLLSLARKHTGRGLEVKAFSKHVEGKEGADWAFWFADGTRQGIGARIQAKRLYADEGRYKSLYHQSNKQKEASKASGLPTPNQCETLINHPDSLVPLYVFYNSDALDFEKLRSTHQQLQWWFWRNFPSHFTEWGISAASPLAIKHADWGKKDQPGDFPMIPWHCLFCSCCWDKRPADSSLAAQVGYGLRQLYELGVSQGKSEESKHDDMHFSFEPTEETPKWVGLLREGSQAEEWLVEEMGQLNLKGVAIIEETEARDE